MVEPNHMNGVGDNKMYFIIYAILFCVYALLPFWLQILLLIISCIIAPGGNSILVIAIIVGAFMKLKMK